MEVPAEQIVDAVVERFARERARQGLTLQELGERAELDRSYIGLIEKGKRSPSLDATIRIADALGLDFPRVLRQAMKKATARSAAK